MKNKPVEKIDWLQGAGWDEWDPQCMVFLGLASAWVRKGKPHLDNVVDGWCFSPSSLSRWCPASGKRDGRPIIADNGAFGRKGKWKEPQAVMDEVMDLVGRIRKEGHPLQFAVLPDVVKDWPATIQAAWDVDRPEGVRWALVIQPGFRVHQVEEYLEAFPETDLFVAGVNFRFQWEAVQAIRHLETWIHVGEANEWWLYDL